jgi:hypothetical protein
MDQGLVPIFIQEGLLETFWVALIALIAVFSPE